MFWKGSHGKHETIRRVQKINKSMKNTKDILITGGTGGIGSNIVRALVEDGHRVTVWSNDKKGYLDLLKAIPNKSNVYFKEIDVANLGQVKKAAKKIKHIDVLINAAGVLWPVKLFMKTDLQEIKRSFEITMWGTVNCCYCLLLKLPKKGGKIINFGGGGGANGRKDHMAYSLAKTSLIRFTENLAIENPELYVNIIAPGSQKTNMWKDETEPHPEKWGNMDDLMIFIKFLVSEKSDGITGKFINVRDDWKNPEFIKKVMTDKDFLTLRRIDDFQFTKLK
jgi:NAD(P)-dependent dehydrogenase (short-subunit alcohol dehydrogenase family)